MKELWNETFLLYKKHIVLWLPCYATCIVMLTLGYLEKAEIHWLTEFFSTQHSFLGGEVHSTVAHVQALTMMIAYPLGFLKQMIEICLFLVALIITKNLVYILCKEQRPDMTAAVQGIVPRRWEILLFALKYMAVFAVFGGILVVLAMSPLESEHFLALLTSKVFLFVYGLIEEGCLAWLLLPSAIRLLRSSDIPIIPVQARKIGTVFAVATTAGSLLLENLVGKAETTIMFSSRLEGVAIALVNTVIINTPLILLFIALALLAIQRVDEEAIPTESPENSCA